MPSAAAGNMLHGRLFEAAFNVQLTRQYYSLRHWFIIGSIFGEGQQFTTPARRRCQTKGLGSDEFETCPRWEPGMDELRWSTAITL